MFKSYEKVDKCAGMVLKKVPSPSTLTTDRVLLLAMSISLPLDHTALLTLRTTFKVMM